MNPEMLVWLVLILLGCSACLLHARLVRLETAMTQVPTHSDMREISERLARVEAQVSQIASSMDTLTRLLMENAK